MKRVLIFAIIFSLIFSLNLWSKSEFMKQFSADYDLVDLDLLTHEGEEFVVENFVFKKDVATFTFEKGVIHLLRYVKDRPTTALFSGEGKVTITVPNHAEQMSLLAISGDSVVNETFENCFIRFADDFDQQLRAKYEPTVKKLKWANFTKIQQEQADLYFKPVIQHTYDNKFQQLISIYEPSPDGYFWVDFNRYNFTFDPNRPEEVIISYEFEPNDFVMTEAAVFQKASKGLTENNQLSQIIYPTTSLAYSGMIEMGGMDGRRLDDAKIEMKLLVNNDSLKYLNSFLHFNLKLDSLYYNGAAVDYYRRKDFRVIETILPEYKHQGDTISLTYFYHGKDFDNALPYVTDPTPSKVNLEFYLPNGFNYIMPGMGEYKKADNGKTSFSVTPATDFNVFRFQGYASGFDTLSQSSTMGFPINFIKSKSIKRSTNCYVEDDIYEPAFVNAFNFMTSKVGPLKATDKIFVYPEGFTNMPGLVEMPQILCYEESYSKLGGFNLFAGHAMAKQWFGYQTKPATYRENWLKFAASEYLNMMFLGHQESIDMYYIHLMIKRDSLFTLQSINRDRTLASGDRAGDAMFTVRGTWLFHMLRYLMYDTESNSESKFNRFFYELAYQVNNQEFTNNDIIKLAEKYYGEPLDWFFDQFFYNNLTPEFNVEYKIEQKGEGYFISGTMNAKKVPADFKMPVIMRVAHSDGSQSMHRTLASGTSSTFEIGPFSVAPKELIFNEFYSVLSKDNINKLE